MISSGSQTFSQVDHHRTVHQRAHAWQIDGTQNIHSVMITTALTLSSQIVDLLGLAFLDFPDDTDGVGDITVVQQERRVSPV
jgi:hypothetical protein